MSTATVSVENIDGGPVLRLGGDLVTEALGAVEQSFARFTTKAPRLTIDLSNLTSLDTGGAWMIADLQARLHDAGVASELVGGSAERTALIETVSRARPHERGVEAPPSGFLPWLAGLGANTVDLFKAIVSLLNFVGLVLHRLAGTLVRPWRLRAISLVSQMQEIGLNAVPIVALMGFLIGIVLAFQGAVQLRQFGAEVFVVDLIAVSVLRELGILLTAIIVAGRSGSAFTASIGSMKVREEIDAMRTLGLDPIEVLVLPRVLALIVMLPILGLIANICALIGGGLMSWAELGISPGMFLTRFVDNTDVWHLGVGMIKAPFFAFIISIVGCWQALQVGGSSESVGQRTTQSVVQSIFLVIVVDAGFSIFFAEVGV
ncbi:ABC transporter permease [Roseobacter sp. YSTF-M11]|uniref:ABC transporter permease n=1 Tax=Roseobacter insulae TaxID=2859783 RepID=A0A9X1FW92_9RHOB|nr:ABC transporter permease [Roseobacter insulae]MBW4709220.1 ABC transporter permease [Roseobacter insulae]